MVKLLIFAGTTEGRELVQALSGQPVHVTACVATAYGETLLPEQDNLTVHTGRMDADAIRDFLSKGGFDLVIDATHPYADIVTRNIVSACEGLVPSLRLLRGASAAPEDAVFVSSVEEAVSFLSGTEGNMLLTTGSKDLPAFSRLPAFDRRVYARVLPMEKSLAACREAGLAPAHILAMQGPFSADMNRALLNAVSARFLVTKDGGSTGGFAEKAEAAAACGAKLVVIGRPPQREGLSFSGVLSELSARFGLSFRPRVTLAGIGPGALSAMTQDVRRALSEADFLIGAPRMLEAAAPGQKTVSAIAPEAISAAVHAHPAGKICVLMSGDTGFFSGSKKLLPLLQDCDVTVLPGLSSMAVLAAKLFMPYDDAVPVSLHGRARDIVPDVWKHKKIFTLVGGKDGVKALCRDLTEAGLGDVLVSVGERLSYPDERLTRGKAAELIHGEFDPLSAVFLENPHAQNRLVCGLPDSAFLRGGGEEPVPMTKSEVRAVCLSKLQLTDEAVCWDIGAGTGSVSIEMALHARRVFAIEKKEAALHLLEENKRRFHTDNLDIVSGAAPDALEALPAPTHVFIGGSGGALTASIEMALQKNPHVRIVATAIALETIGPLNALMPRFEEAEAVSLSCARGRKAGPYHLMTGLNPIFLFTFQNP